MVECPVCGGTIILTDNTVVGELIECPECGIELEVKKVDPYIVEEAPLEDEDWDQ